MLTGPVMNGKGKQTGGVSYNPGTRTKWRIWVLVVYRLKMKPACTTLWSYFCSTPYRCAAYEDTYTFYYTFFTSWAN